MNEEQALPLKMELVRSIFETSGQFARTQHTMGPVHEHLAQIAPEFRTVAYEAVSMGLVLGDLTRVTGSSLWPAFASGSGTIYVPDIYTGLGCALAHEGKDLYEAMSASDPSMHYRIIDGYGFYKGMFRQRQSVQQQSIPGGIGGISLRYHDQGLGRSLWYLTGGNSEKAAATIQKFAAVRQAELWRGIGIAASYLGGCSEPALHALFLSAGACQAQLLSGAAISAKARIQSATSNADTEMVCRLWCNSTAAEAAALAEEALSKASTEPQQAYGAWVSLLDKQFTTTGVIHSS